MWRATRVRPAIATWVENVDVALLPMNLPDTMTPAEAGSVRRDRSPRRHPYHYMGQKPEEFAAAKGQPIEVRLLNWYPAAQPLACRGGAAARFTTRGDADYSQKSVDNRDGSGGRGCAVVCDDLPGQNSTGPCSVRTTGAERMGSYRYDGQLGHRGASGQPGRVRIHGRGERSPEAWASSRAGPFVRAGGMERKRQYLKNRMVTKMSNDPSRFDSGDRSSSVIGPGCRARTTCRFRFRFSRVANRSLLIYEYKASIRQVYVDPHMEAPVDSWMGWSNGSWDGDTLVVDVKGFNGHTWFDRAGNFATDALHIVERWTPRGGIT